MDTTPALVRAALLGLQSELHALDGAAEHLIVAIDRPDPDRSTEVVAADAARAGQRVRGVLDALDTIAWGAGTRSGS